MIKLNESINSIIDSSSIENINIENRSKHELVSKDEFNVKSERSSNNNLEINNENNIQNEQINDFISIENQIENKSNLLKNFKKILNFDFTSFL